jgi:hypothetical protein
MLAVTVSLRDTIRIFCTRTDPNKSRIHRLSGKGQNMKRVKRDNSRKGSVTHTVEIDDIERFGIRFDPIMIARDSNTYMII